MKKTLVFSLLLLAGSINLFSIDNHLSINGIFGAGYTNNTDTFMDNISIFDKINKATVLTGAHFTWSSRGSNLGIITELGYMQYTNSYRYYFTGNHPTGFLHHKNIIDSIDLGVGLATGNNLLTAESFFFLMPQFSYILYENDFSLVFNAGFRTNVTISEKTGLGYSLGAGLNIFPMFLKDGNFLLSYKNYQYASGYISLGISYHVEGYRMYKERQQNQDEEQADEKLTESDL